VFEHATYSFIFHNVSRVFTHELVRHRAGVAISQESLRFVRLNDISCWFPRSLEQELNDNDGDGLRQRWVSIIESIEDFQQRAADHLGLDEEGVPFSRKKEMTSAMRRMLPEGVATVVLWTANIRAIRHCIEARTARGAEEEIRLVFDQVASIMVREVPDVFADYVRTPVPGTTAGEWTTDFMKV
jgi:thymidylate synthase (FAD)